MNFITCRDTNMLYSYSDHTHNCWEIIRQSVGSTHAYANGKTFDMLEGDLILIPPGISHSCRGEELFGDMFIQFSSCNMAFSPIIIHDLDGNIGKLMKMIIKLHTEKEAYYEEIIESMLDAILVYIRKSADAEIKFPFVHKFKDTLYKNLGKSDFNIGDAINECGYNPDYFRRCFKKEFGRSPLEYLTALRIAKAEELLLQDDFSGVENVSAQCGFSDSFYFSTCFKKHNGLSPLSYRKSKRSAGF